MENKPTLRLSGVAVLGLVIVLCALAYFLANHFVNMRANRLEVISVSARSDQNVQTVGDGLMYYDGAMLHALDGRGRQVWTHNAGSYADFHVSEAGVATWSGAMLSLLSLNNGTAQFSGQVGSTVISARMGRYYSAVQIMPRQENSGQTEADLTEHNSTMLILDPGGRQVDRIPLPSQTVIDFGFFYDGRLFWVMSLDTEGTVPVCTITTYKPSQMLTGVIDDPTQLVYKVMFQQSKIRTVGLTYIKDWKYTGEEIEENRLLIYGWSLIDMDEKQANPLMVFVPTNQSDGTLGVSDLRTIQGQEDRSIRLPGAASQVFARGNTVYAFSNDRVMVWDQRQTEPTTFALPVYIERVIALTDNHTAIVAAGNAVYMIPLK